MNKKDEKWLKDQAVLINDTAYEVYGAVQGGVKQNFFNGYHLYSEQGVFGWVKESRSFEVAVSIYEIYTSNEGWDVVEQIIEKFPDILDIRIEEFKKLTSE